VNVAFYLLRGGNFLRREAQLAIYRAYFIKPDNHIQERREIEAPSDEEAVRIAKQWRDGLAIEVWLDEIYIETIKPKPKRW
jgi:hypothetical protein